MTATRMWGWAVMAAALAWVAFVGDAALAEEIYGQPRPGQLGFQLPASPIMSEINSFHNMLLVIIIAITTIVLALLLYVMWRYNAKANPVPSKNSHNTLVEVVWTVLPILILVVIAVPSFQLLYYVDGAPQIEDVKLDDDGNPVLDSSGQPVTEWRTAEADEILTIKTTGYQWYWGYQYPDLFGDYEFIASIIPDDEIDASKGQVRLLSTDFDVVVPVGKPVRVIVTAADVIHNWAMPAFGVKMDAVPGRLNETWFTAEREGMFYGQCSELCGIQHAFMPISVKVVSEAEFEEWTQRIRQEEGIAAAPELNSANIAVASNE